LPATHVLQRKCACGGTPGPTGECEQCRKKKLQRAPNHRSPLGPHPSEAPPIVHEVLRSPGRPLDADTRAFMEPRFGHDFGRVRVHTGAKAEGSARAVKALAYTVGDQVVFGAGQYTPDTITGRRLLAHELAHVVQQKGTALQAQLNIGQSDDVYEQEAASVASTIENNHLDRALKSVNTTAGALQSPARVQRLGANPTCTKTETEGIHQAIFDARGWLNKAIPKLEESPLSATVLASLRKNFGSTYGVAANAALVEGRLKVGRAALGRIPFACDTAGATPSCAAQQCGWTVAGSNAATICTNPPSTLSVAWPRAADCVLHESLHASMAFMTVDNYKVNPGYPGVGTEPLLNAESYTKLAMDLS